MGLEKVSIPIFFRQFNKRSVMFCTIFLVHKVVVELAQQGDGNSGNGLLKLGAENSSFPQF